MYNAVYCYILQYAGQFKFALTLMLTACSFSNKKNPRYIQVMILTYENIEVELHIYIIYSNEYKCTSPGLPLIIILYLQQNIIENLRTNTV